MAEIYTEVVDSGKRIVFSVGAVAFSISMMGSILSKTQKPPRFSCIITAFFLWLYLAVYFSYGLWFSTIMGVFSASGWTVLVFQKRVKLDNLVKSVV